MSDDMERRAREWWAQYGGLPGAVDYTALAAFGRTIRREALEEAAGEADFACTQYEQQHEYHRRHGKRGSTLEHATERWTAARYVADRLRSLIAKEQQ